MTMIEKVAKAIYYSNCGDEQGVFENIDASYKQLFIDEAKAAIEAMREPTEEMIKHLTVDDQDAIPYYKAMIDAALKE